MQSPGQSTAQHGTHLSVVNIREINKAVLFHLVEEHSCSSTYVHSHIKYFSRSGDSVQCMSECHVPVNKKEFPTRNNVSQQQQQQKAV